MCVKGVRRQVCEIQVGYSVVEGDLQCCKCPVMEMGSMFKTLVREPGFFFRKKIYIVFRCFRDWIKIVPW